MQNDEIKKNHKKNQGMFFESIWLTQLTCHAQHEIRIKKKIDFQKKNLAKKDRN
jgi:hypothetical protein